MAALTNDNTLSVKLGTLPLPEFISIGVAASTLIYQGSLVAINSAGYAVPASSTAGLVVIGRAESRVDNTTGASNDKLVRVGTGVFKLKNSASTEALTIADIGKSCFAVDDQTVARTTNRGARPLAGRVVEITTDGVYVLCGPVNSDGTIDVLITASAVSLATKQYYFVSVNASGLVELSDAAGECALGVLQNAPAASGIAIVRVSGLSRCIAGGVVAPGDIVATLATGKAKTAVLSDASAVGSHGLGIALNTANTVDLDNFPVLVSHMGLLPASLA